MYDEAEEGADDQLPISETDMESALSHLSDDILINSMIEQIGKVGIQGTAPENILRILDDRRAYLEAKYEGDRYSVDAITDMMASIRTKVLDAICERFDIGREPGQSLGQSDISHLYRFFVTDYRENLVTYAASYVFQNRKPLSQEFKGPEDRKDLAWSNIRKSVRTPEDASIVYNLDDILESLPTMIDDGEEMAESLSRADDSMHLQVIYDLLCSGERLSPGLDFVVKFLSPLKDEESAGALSSQVRVTLVRSLAS
jgi:hypothetical protein